MQISLHFLYVFCYYIRFSNAFLRVFLDVRISRKFQRFNSFIFYFTLFLSHIFDLLICALTIYSLQLKQGYRLTALKES